MMAKVLVNVKQEVEACGRCGFAAVPHYPVKIDAPCSDTQFPTQRYAANWCKKCIDALYRFTVKRTRKPKAVTT